MRLTLLFIASLLFLSCDRKECSSANPVFANNPPHSKAYKDELLRELDKPENKDVEYWFKSYEERDNRTYMHLYVQNDSICAVAELLVTKWGGEIANIKKVKGRSYGGAEVIGLKYRVEKDADHTELIYVSMDDMID